MICCAGLSRLSTGVRWAIKSLNCMANEPYSPENNDNVQAIAVHSPCLAPVGIFGSAPSNVPNALAANEAMRHAPTPAHSRPPNEI